MLQSVQNALWTVELSPVECCRTSCAPLQHVSTAHGSLSLICYAMSRCKLPSCSHPDPSQALAPLPPPTACQALQARVMSHVMVKSVFFVSARVQSAKRPFGPGQRPCRHVGAASVRGRPGRRGRRGRGRAAGWRRRRCRLQKAPNLLGRSGVPRADPASLAALLSHVSNYGLLQEKRREARQTHGLSRPWGAWHHRKTRPLVCKVSLLCQCRQHSRESWSVM